MVRQGAALRLLLRTRRRVRANLRGARDLLVLQPELELVEGLRGSAEALPAQAGKLAPELLDQQIAVAQFGIPRRQLGPRGQHHRLQRGDVVGQGLSLFEHGRTLPERAAKGKPEWKSTHC